MDTRSRITAAVKDAMKAKDTARLATLRLANAALKDLDIAARGDGKEVGEADVMALLAKMVKQRQESVRAYEEGGRAELAAAERAEIAVLEGFLPQKLSEEETAAAIDAALAETGAKGLRDMGRVMAVLKERHTGQLDFAKVGPLVKARLA